MREVSEKRFDDPEKKMGGKTNEIVDDRTPEEKRAHFDNLYNQIFGDDSLDGEIDQEVDEEIGSKTFNDAIKADIAETQRQQREATTADIQRQVEKNTLETPLQAREAVAKEEQRTEHTSLEDKRIASLNNEMKLLESQHQEELKKFYEQQTNLLGELEKYKTDPEMKKQVELLLYEVYDKEKLCKLKHQKEISDISYRIRYGDEFVERMQNPNPKFRLGGGKTLQPSVKTEPNSDKPSQQVDIDGQRVEHRKYEEEHDVWYINGEKIASRKSSPYDIVEKETTPGYRETFKTVNGIELPELKRAPELDTKMEKITMLYEGKPSGEITKTDLPLMDGDDKVVGRETQRVTERGNHYRRTETMTTLANSPDKIGQDVIIDGDNLTLTNSVNGKSVFKMEKSNEGTVITRFKDGHEIPYYYDKDGNPIEEKNGYIKIGDSPAVVQHYPGIKKIPNIPEGLNDIKRINEPRIKEYWDFMAGHLDRGIPEELIEKRKNSVLEMYKPNPIIQKAKDTMENNRDTISKQTESDMDR